MREARAIALLHHLHVKPVRAHESQTRRPVFIHIQTNFKQNPPIWDDGQYNIFRHTTLSSTGECVLATKPKSQANQVGRRTSARDNAVTPKRTEQTTC